jgi:hypothetical protein
MKFSRFNVIAALFLGVAIFIGGCAKKDASPLSTGQVVQNPAIDTQLFGYVGDGPYAIVKADALPDYYQSFRKRLFDDGVVKWDERFDCNHFVSYYVALAQTQFYLKNWGATTPAQTLAMAEVWYRPGGGKKGHAIVAAQTDRGLLFIEPQTGRTVTLSPAERQSVFLVKW